MLLLRDNPINDEGYKRLLEKLFDIPEWYHEYHYMLQYIVRYASKEHIKKYMRTTRNELSYKWCWDVIPPTEEGYKKVIACYESLD